MSTRTLLTLGAVVACGDWTYSSRASLEVCQCLLFRRALACDVHVQALSDEDVAFALNVARHGTELAGHWTLLEDDAASRW